MIDPTRTSPMPHTALADHKAEGLPDALRSGALPKELPKLTAAQKMCKFARIVHVRRGLKRMETRSPKVDGNSKYFLGLPGEVRNLVYDHCVADAKSLHTGPTLLTPESIECKSTNGMATRRSIYIQSDEEYLEAHGLSTRARTAFKSYQTAHAMEMTQNDDDDKQQTPDLVRINKRGNLCENLPALALTCHQILGELWGLYFLGSRDDTDADHIRYTARVKNFEFFPLLRFFQRLQSTAKVQVPGYKVDVVLEDDANEQATSTTKYDKIKTLIQLDGLEGLPLWGCMTGQREEEGLQQRPAREIRAKREFWRWMDRVRHIVALCHINPDVWQEFAIKTLGKWDDVANPTQPPQSWVDLLKEDIAEGVIEMLSDAIDYRCGYIGLWGNGEEDQENLEDLGEEPYSSPAAKSTFYAQTQQDRARTPMLSSALDRTLL